jgi:hypothetical protein
MEFLRNTMLGIMVIGGIGLWIFAFASLISFIRSSFSIMLLGSFLYTIMGGDPNIVPVKMFVGVVNILILYGGYKLIKWFLK